MERIVTIPIEEYDSLREMKKEVEDIYLVIQHEDGVYEYVKSEKMLVLDTEFKIEKERDEYRNKFLNLKEKRDYNGFFIKLLIFFLAIAIVTIIVLI